MTTSTGYSLDSIHGKLGDPADNITVEWLHENTSDETMRCTRPGSDASVHVGLIDGSFEIDSGEAHWSTPDRSEAVCAILAALGCFE